jgi:hypothetical protein
LIRPGGPRIRRSRPVRGVPDQGRQQARWAHDPLGGSCLAAKWVGEGEYCEHAPRAPVRPDALVNGLVAGPERVPVVSRRARLRRPILGQTRSVWGISGPRRPSGHPPPTAARNSASTGFLVPQMSCVQSTVREHLRCRGSSAQDLTTPEDDGGPDSVILPAGDRPCSDRQTPPFDEDDVADAAVDRRRRPRLLHRRRGDAVPATRTQCLGAMPSPPTQVDLE